MYFEGKTGEKSHCWRGALWLLALGGSLATVKRFADLESVETLLVMGVLVALAVAKVAVICREQTASILGIAGVLLGVVGVCAAAIIGVPEQARGLPNVADLALIGFPIVVFIGALIAGLVGLAHWRGPGEFKGVAQRSRLMVALNLILAAISWQVVRQSTSLPVIEGLTRLPQVQNQRVAVERLMREFVDGVVDPVPSQAGAKPGPAADDRPPILGDREEPWVRARLAERAGDLASAAEAWEQAADAAGHDPAVELIAARALVLADRAPDALQRLERVRTDGHDSPELSLLQAKLLVESSRGVEAAGLYEPVLTQGHGTEDDIRRYLGLLVEMGQIQRALVTTERIMVRRPNRRLDRWRAFLQAASGDHDTALSTLRRLAMSTPFDPVDAYRLGEIANDAGRPQVALAAVSRLLEAGENTPRTTLIAARAYGALGMSQEAARLSRSSAPPLDHALQQDIDSISLMQSRPGS